MSPRHFDDGDVLPLALAAAVHEEEVAAIEAATTYVSKKPDPVEDDE